jgi:benzoate/toluate 1,2-dioxygenase alpha subunit
MMWGSFPNPEERCNYPQRSEIASRIGEIRADWAVGKLRNLLLYPSLFVMDNRGSQLRIVRPISVDMTEVTTYLVAPVGEPPELKRRRLRQYEDFFNPSGMATPDDLAEFVAVQEGMNGRLLRHSDLSRGARNQVMGQNQHARNLGISPVSSGEACADEGIYIGQYKQWIDLMTSGLERTGRG